MEADRTIGNVCPPSVDIVTETFAALTGLELVPFTSHVTVCVVPEFTVPVKAIHLTELQSYYYRLGHVRYVRKYARFPLATALPPFIFRLLAEACRFRWAALRGNGRGWRDGWRNG